MLHSYALAALLNLSWATNHIWIRRHTTRRLFRPTDARKIGSDAERTATLRADDFSARCQGTLAVPCRRGLCPSGRDGRRRVEPTPTVIGPGGPDRARCGSFYFVPSFFCSTPGGWDQSQRVDVWRMNSRCTMSTVLARTVVERERGWMQSTVESEWLLRASQWRQVLAMSRLGLLRTLLGVQYSMIATQVGRGRKLRRRF